MRTEVVRIALSQNQENAEADLQAEFSDENLANQKSRTPENHTAELSGKFLADQQPVFQHAGEVLRSGGIVAFPTDTVYGLGAICTDEAAVQKLFQAKGRDEGKPLSILISDIAQVQMLAEEIPPKAQALMEAFWPGALTVILKKKPQIPMSVTAGGDTIGIRMPDLPETRAVIASAGTPLAAPSANTSGKRSAVTGADVLEDLDGRIDLLIDGGACPVGVASTVVDLTGAEPVILREGVITEQMIRDVCWV